MKKTKKTKKTKLQLSTDIIRQLTAQETTIVVGGVARSKTATGIPACQTCCSPSECECPP